MVSVAGLVLHTVDREFKQWSGQTTNYEIGIYCFSAKHAALGSRITDWLSRNQSAATCLPADCYFGEVAL